MYFILGHYALLEASGFNPNSSADLVSKFMTFGSQQCLQFFYHMYGKDSNKLKVSANIIGVFHTHTVPTFNFCIKCPDSQSIIYKILISTQCLGIDA